MKPPTWFRTAAVVAGLVLIGTVESLQAQEFFTHVNGDSINADIKGFGRGKLSYEIPGSSSASIEFQNVVTMGSPDDWDI